MKLPTSPPDLQNSQNLLKFSPSPAGLPLHFSPINRSCSHLQQEDEKSLKNSSHIRPRPVSPPSELPFASIRVKPPYFDQIRPLQLRNNLSNQVPCPVHTFRAKGVDPSHRYNSLSLNLSFRLGLRASRHNRFERRYCNVDASV